MRSDSSEHNNINYMMKLFPSFASIPVGRTTVRRDFRIRVLLEQKNTFSWNVPIELSEQEKALCISFISIKSRENAKLVRAMMKKVLRAQRKTFFVRFFFVLLGSLFDYCFFEQSDQVKAKQKMTKENRMRKSVLANYLRCTFMRSFYNLFDLICSETISVVLFARFAYATFSCGGHILCPSPAQRIFYLASNF